MIAINDAEGSGNGGPPRRIKLLGAGVLTTRDGRGPYKNLDPEAIVASSEQLLLEAGIPIDINHSIDTKSPLGEPSPAAGWVRSLTTQNGEVWADVEWTNLGVQALSRGPRGEPPEYRYVSPVIQFSEQSGEISTILRASITNNPNMFATAIAQRQMKTTEQKIEQLRAEMAADALSEAEEAICVQTGISHSDFRAARTKRREVALNEANARPVKIEPFTIDRVPPPRFVGIN